MKWFSRDDKPLNSEEYEKLHKKITELNSSIEALHTRFEVLQTNYNDLRGKFNRKLSGLKKEDLEEEQKTETQTINSQVILPYNGDFKLGK